MPSSFTFMEAGTLTFKKQSQCDVSVTGTSGTLF